MHIRWTTLGTTVAKVRTTLHINQGYVRAVMSQEGLGGRAVRRAANLTAKRAQQNIKVKYQRVRTGKMWRTTKAGKQTRLGPLRSRIMVTTGVPYSVYQHEGTRTISPAPYLTDALRELRPEDFAPGASAT